MQARKALAEDAIVSTNAAVNTGACSLFATEYGGQRGIFRGKITDFLLTLTGKHPWESWKIAQPKKQEKPCIQAAFGSNTRRLFGGVMQKSR